MAEALEIRLRAFLIRMRRVTVASGRMQITCSRTLPAIRIPGMAPWRATMPAHAERRAAFTARVIRACARGPPAATSLSIRHAVGTEATGPNRSCSPASTGNR